MSGPRDEILMSRFCSAMTLDKKVAQSLFFSGKYSLGKGSKKKIKKNYGKFHIRGGGRVSRGHFPYPIFFIFYAPNGLKIILDIEVFFYV